ncbi:MAG TPA: aromatic ring-hydroxylating dioxygenase subunit alpha [Steroidobacteraceae bacterium]|nr:aromatic ring-hydroxylating dioxygenase subunit alpha [Steroidobacteraceae bacterium]
MSAPLTSESLSVLYNGLEELEGGLPAQWYYDPGQYERELAGIWRKTWIYVGRSSEVAERRAYMTFALAGQQILLVRGDDGVLRGFHNTCRHRGAALCLEPRGTLRSSSVVCPYHAWVYSLKGDLVRTSSKTVPPGFSEADYPLYAVKVQEWRGFVFISLADDPPTLEEALDFKTGRLARWPLEELVVAHTDTKVIQCNWKLFWENFSECLHCPGIHPSLCQLVPLFGRGYIRERDDPHWQEHAEDPNPLYRGGLRAGAQSWSTDGTAAAPIFPGLSAEDRKLGQVYLTSLPSVFIAAHVDYVRAVRLWPLGPERMELRVEYLFAPEALASPGFNLRKVVDFADRVMGEDAYACEINQRGQRALPHRAGVVMPEEYMVHAFHQWVRARL